MPKHRVYTQAEMDAMPRTAEEARALGVGKYFSGKPCRHGHIAPRSSKKKTCFECQALFHVMANREWDKRNPDKRREYDLRNKARAKAAGKKAKPATPEQREQKRRYVKENAGAHRALVANRRMAKANATPAWLTVADNKLIAQMYRESALMTKCLGREFNVDHIVPIQGKTVCGLHVPANLRVISAEINNRRPRIWDPNQEAA